MAHTTRSCVDNPILTKRLTLDELDQLAGLTRPGGTAMKPEARLRKRMEALAALAELANAPEVRR